MKSKTALFSSILLVAVLLAACRAGVATPFTIVEEPTGESIADMSTEAVITDEHTPDEMLDSTSRDELIPQSTSDQTASEMMDERTPDATMENTTPEAMMDDSLVKPGWFNSSLIDVRSGEQFTISELKGKVVLVETLAMWCSNCLKQQKHVLALHSLLGERDDFVSLGLDIDPNEVGQALQDYTDNNGFHWSYAISPAEVSREIGQLYGDQFLNPPSTPMLIIDRNGQAHPLPFGIKDAQSLMEALLPFLAESI